jgi:hypothetical protein
MIITHDIINFNTEFCNFDCKQNEVNIAKLLKGTYRGNKPRFKEKFINYFEVNFRAYEIEEFIYLLENIEIAWDYVEPFTYKEAFEIEDNLFKSSVFSSIDIREMINNLGANKIKVEGIDLVNKSWNPYKNEFENIPYSVIYELYQVNGEKLGIRDSSRLSIVKCWCTTTDEEHWLWVDSNSFSNDSPLEAIASTCVIYKSMHGHIKHIIRQGDVFIFEMNEDITPSENEETMSLPMSEYFGLLKSQA